MAEPRIDTNKHQIFTTENTEGHGKILWIVDWKLGIDDGASWVYYQNHELRSAATGDGTAGEYTLIILLKGIYGGSGKCDGVGRAV